MSTKTGRNLFKLEGRYIKAANRTFDLFFKDLAKEMTEISKEIAEFYSFILGGMSLDKETGGIKLTTANSLKVSAAKMRAERMSKGFSKRITTKLGGGRKAFLGERGTRDKEAKKILKKEGIEVNYGDIPDKTKQLLRDLGDDSSSQIVSFFNKWVHYFPHIIRTAISTGQNPARTRELLLLPNGHIRVGSSLEEAVYREAAMDLLRQRTAQTVSEAQRLKLTHCWNANPMDSRTKPICASATTVGIIPLQDMEDNYGFPPRFVCRCDLMITDPSWVEINQGVNQAIEQRRKEVIKELQDLPSQMTSWRVSGYTRADGTRVAGSMREAQDPLRAEGLRRYQEVEDRIEIWSEREVPEYIYSG